MARAETLRAEIARLKDNVRWRGERLRESQGEVDEARARRLMAEDRERIGVLEGELRALAEEGGRDAMLNYVSREGAEELANLRVEGPIEPVGSAPIELLARVPSAGCGCPEELWRVDGMIYLIHMEAEAGTGEIFVFGDGEQVEWSVKAASLDHLRAEMFARHAAAPAEAAE